MYTILFKSASEMRTLNSSDPDHVVMRRNWRGGLVRPALYRLGQKHKVSQGAWTDQQTLLSKSPTLGAWRARVALGIQSNKDHHSKKTKGQHHVTTHFSTDHQPNASQSTSNLWFQNSHFKCSPQELHWCWMN